MAVWRRRGPFCRGPMPLRVHMRSTIGPHNRRLLFRQHRPRAIDAFGKRRLWEQAALHQEAVLAKEVAFRGCESHLVSPRWITGAGKRNRFMPSFIRPPHHLAIVEREGTGRGED